MHELQRYRVPSFLTFGCLKMSPCGLGPPKARLESTVGFIPLRKRLRGRRLYSTPEALAWRMSLFHSGSGGVAGLFIQPRKGWHGGRLYSTPETVA